MKKCFLSLCIVWFFAGCAQAEVVTIDPSAWTQDQKNMTHLAVANVLDEFLITRDKVIINLPTIDVVNPSSSVAPVLTQSAIETKYSEWRTAQDIIDAADIAEEAAMVNEAKANELRGVDLSNIESKIDAISNLSEAKVFMKKLTRYLWAIGAFGD